MEAVSSRLAVRASPHIASQLTPENVSAQGSTYTPPLVCFVKSIFSEDDLMPQCDIKQDTETTIFMGSFHTWTILT